MVRLEVHKDGIILPVRVRPGARRNGIIGTHDGALKVAVAQAAEKGKANQAVAEVLCDVLDLGGSEIELIAGATARQKRFLLRGVAIDELKRRIATALTAAR